jgi:hypothetical protein
VISSGSIFFHLYVPQKQWFGFEVNYTDFHRFSVGVRQYEALRMALWRIDVRELVCQGDQAERYYNGRSTVGG